MTVLNRYVASLRCGDRHRQSWTVPWQQPTA